MRYIRTMVITGMIFAAGNACGQEPAPTWVTAGAYSEMHIVIPDSPSEDLIYAAQMFQKYWKAATGCKIDVSEVNEGAINVWLGPEVLTPDLLNPMALEGLSDTGCLIKTYTPPRRAKKMGAHKQLIITGKTDRGTLNGVFEFLERFIKVQWLSPDFVVRTPINYFFPGIDHQYNPPFAFTEVGYCSLWPETGQEYRRAHHFPPEIPPGPSNAHTFYVLLPPDQYFDKHPEYYAQIDGKRVAVRGDWRQENVRRGQAGQIGQLCCGNPATAEAVLQSLISLINADPKTADPEIIARRNALCPFPDKKIWSVSQMDWLRPCQCPLCREIDAREESPMGSLLTMVNYVAEGLEKAFPEAGYKVHTLAYQYSRKPPKTLRPRENVIMQVCDFECDFARPLDDPQSPVNAAFVQDLSDWSRLTEELYVLDYVANLDSGQRPHPNLQVLQPNIQCFDQYNVKGIYAHAVEPPSWPFSECDVLRSYMLSEFLWDPDMPYPAVLENFAKPYYGAAAPKIKEYLELMSAFVRDNGVYLNASAPPYWWNYDLVVKAESLFQEALTAPIGDKERPHVEKAHLPVQYAALVCPPRIHAENNRLIFERPPSLSLEEYLAAVKTHSGDIKERPVRDPANDIKRDCGGDTPPRREEYALETLENDRYLVWVVPELNGAILRWQDKQLGVELLRGFQFYGSRAGVWQEWPAPPSEAEGPLKASYAVAERAPDHLTLRAALENGLILTRILRLTPGSDNLEYTLEIQNPGTEPAALPIKVHPEFFAQTSAEPEIWARENDAWSRLQGNEGYAGASWNALHRPAAGITRWAFHAPEAGISIVNELEAAQIEQLCFYYNMTDPRQQVNLELVLPSGPIAPGETRRLDTRYWAVKARPETL